MYNNELLLLLLLLYVDYFTKYVVKFWGEDNPVTENWGKHGE